MDSSFFSGLFSELELPVIVCANTSNFPVEYMNVQAGLLFTPSYSTVQTFQQDATLGVLTDVLPFATPDEYRAFAQTARSARHISGYRSNARSFEGKDLPVQVFGNSITAEKSDDYFVFYLVVATTESTQEFHPLDSILAEVINVSFMADTADDSIQSVLALSGREMGVSRTYIFEEVSPTTTRNTYEWCAPGVQPAIQDLQNLDKADYPYDVIVNAGMYIANDVSKLPDGEREILEMQGIRALAIIPMFDSKGPLGYVGYDDCEKNRQWSHEETRFLKSISVLLAGLIKRRNADQAVLHSHNVLQLVSDNLDDIIYANRVDDYTLLFVSRSLSQMLGKPPEELLGKVCWQAFGFSKDGPCSYCPIPKIQLEEGAERSDVYVWEHYNPVVGKDFLIKDNLVKWVDGSLAHVETATDISQRKQDEERLRYYASVDTMTGAYKREWGASLLEELLHKPATNGSLVFVDLDGLKRVNDAQGHAIGDQLITDILDSLRQVLGKDVFLCRWGGDEFLLYLDMLQPAADAAIRQVQANMEQLNSQPNRSYQLSFSYGISPFFYSSTATLDSIVTKADALMYQNKMEKRGWRRRKEDQ